jgi:hypothetical protein
MLSVLVGPLERFPCTRSAFPSHHLSIHFARGEHSRRGRDAIGTTKRPIAATNSAHRASGEGAARHVERSHGSVARTGGTRLAALVHVPAAGSFRTVVDSVDPLYPYTERKAENHECQCDRACAATLAFMVFTISFGIPVERVVSSRRCDQRADGRLQSAYDGHRP